MKKLLQNRIKVLYIVFFAILVIELAGSIVGLFHENIETVNASKTNIFLILVTTIVIIIPWFVEYKYKVDIPDILEFIVLAMLFIAVILGFLHNYYVEVKGFDKLTHMLSGVTLALLSFQLIVYFNQSDEVKLRVGAGMTALLSFSFSMMWLVIWEFYEFSVDVISFQINGPGNSNMQRYQWERTSDFFPQDYGLYDTMIDLWVGAFGALTVAIIGYVAIRKSSVYMTKKISK